MSSPLLLIQTGTPPDALRAAAGDLPPWFATALGCTPQDMDIVRVFAGEALPAPGLHRAAILTGSWAMVTDRLPWSETTAAWIRQAVAQAMPLFGVCYGHQLMAHALGGEVGYLPDAPEIGTLPVTCLPAAATDPLLATAPPQFSAHLTHFQTVLRLPPGAQALARSAQDAHQAVRYAPNAVSVQFHPEFTPDILTACLHAGASTLRAQGRDPDAIQHTIAPTPVPLALMRCFVETHLQQA